MLSSHAASAQDQLKSAQNEAYGVLGEGVPQFDDIIYFSVETKSAPSQSIALRSNVAYGTSRSVNTEPEYAVPHYY